MPTWSSARMGSTKGLVFPIYMRQMASVLILPSPFVMMAPNRRSARDRLMAESYYLARLDPEMARRLGADFLDVSKELVEEETRGGDASGNTERVLSGYLLAS